MKVTVKQLRTYHKMIEYMESGIITVEFHDGSTYEVYYTNSSQKKRIILSLRNNTHKIKAWGTRLSGIHNVKDFEKVINVFK